MQYGCYILKTIRNPQKNGSPPLPSWAMHNLSTKCHQNLFKTFNVIQLTDQLSKNITFSSLCFCGGNKKILHKKYKKATYRK